MTTVSSLTRSHSVLLHKKNENIHPFESTESLEFLAGKNDCGLVLFANSSKKRPNALTIARMFDGKTLDMCELLLLPPLDGQESNEEVKRIPIGVDMKPMILFAGNVWDDSSASDQGVKFTMLKSLFLDVFQGEETKTIDVEGLQFLMMVAASDPEEGQEPVIHLRWYKIRTKKSGQKLPRVEVDEIGPKFDFRLARIKEADPTMWKEAMKKGRRPDEARKRKNIDMDIMGDKVGRVHLGRQDLSELQTRKMKGLKRGNDEYMDTADDDDGDVDLMIEGNDDDMDAEDDDDQGSVEFDVDFDGDDAEDGGMDLDEVEQSNTSKPAKKQRRK